MPSREQRKPTIKMFACEYFQRVNYIDIYGRKVGYDYAFILAEIMKQFPSAKTSKKWLRRMAYEVKTTARMPVRRHSRRALAEGYAMAMLLRRSGRHAHGNIVKSVRQKFPDQHVPKVRLRSLDRWLANNGFPIPPRL